MIYDIQYMHTCAHCTDNTLDLGDNCQSANVTVFSNYQPLHFYSYANWFQPLPKRILRHMTRT